MAVIDLRGHYRCLAAVRGHMATAALLVLLCWESGGGSE